MNTNMANISIESSEPTFLQLRKENANFEHLEKYLKNDTSILHLINDLNIKLRVELNNEVRIISI